MGVIGCIFGFMLRTDILKITLEALNLIAQIDEFKGAWRALRSLATDRSAQPTFIDELFLVAKQPLGRFSLPAHYGSFLYSFYGITDAFFVRLVNYCKR